MQKNNLLQNLNQHVIRFVRHVFGLEQGLVDLFREGKRHRAGLVWGGLIAGLHLAAGSHDTLSLLGVLELKPEGHSIHLLESGLAILVWLGHLIDD